MITRDKMNVSALKYAPDPVYVDYWIDLTADPTGNVVKSFSDGEWIPLNTKINSDLWRIIQEVIDSIGLNDDGTLPPNDNTFFTGDSIVDLLANADSQLNDILDDIEDLQEFAATKGLPGGLAELDENGTVPKNQLPAYVDDVIDVYATFHVSETGLLSDIHLYKDAAHTDEIEEGESDKIYVNITGENDPGFDGEQAGDAKYKAVPYQFRWSGSQWVHLDSNALILGEITGTAFDGGRGKKLEQLNDSITELVKHIDDAPVLDATSASIKYVQGTKQDGVFTYENKTLTLSAANSLHAGLMTNTEYDQLKTAASIPDPIVSTAEVQQNDVNNVYLHLTEYKKGEDGLYADELKANLVIKGATATVAGVMTSAQVKALETDIPASIQTEKTRAEAKEAELVAKDTAMEATLTAAKAQHESDKKQINDTIDKINKAAGLTDQHTLPELTNTHYLNNKDEVEEGLTGVTSLFSAAVKLDDTIYDLHKALDLHEELPWYGVKFDMGSNNGQPDGVRTGNLKMHKDLPIQNKMRGCVIDDKDNTIKYLNPTNWRRYDGDDTTEVADQEGSHWNFFVEIPEHYRLFLLTPDNNIEIRISEYNIPGYTHVEKKYIGAYEATTDPKYSVGEGEPDSLSYKVLWSRPNWQKPVVSMKRNDMLKAARKSPDIVDGNNRTNNWNMYTYGAHVDMTWLFVVEYATLNSLKAFKKALTPEGYHQGGLGDGVTKGYASGPIYNWVPCGVTHKLANASGIALYEKDSTGAESVTLPEQSNNGNFVGGNGNVTKTEVPRYRGIENPFGHVWKNTVDVIVTGDGAKPHSVYVCKDYTKFNSDISQTISGDSFSQDGYELQPFKEVAKEGYLKELVGTNYGDLFAKECNGASTNYYTDYHWTYTTNDNNTAYTLLIGGRSAHEAYAGLFGLYSAIGVGQSTVSVGTRLTFYGEPSDPKAAAAKALAYSMQPQYQEGPSFDGMMY